MTYGSRNILLLFFFQALVLANLVSSQEAFTRQKTCSNDASITGYNNLTDLNSDMQDELNRIAGGGTIPSSPYVLSLCPGQTFTQTDSIKPILNDLTIVCGNPTAPTQTCIINGNGPNIDFSNSTVPGYTINNLVFDSLTFENFNVVSVNGFANAPTTATFKNITWQVSTTTKLWISPKCFKHCLHSLPIIAIFF